MRWNWEYFLMIMKKLSWLFMAKSQKINKMLIFKVYDINRWIKKTIFPLLSPDQASIDAYDCQRIVISSKSVSLLETLKNSVRTRRRTEDTIKSIGWTVHMLDEIGRGLIMTIRFSSYHYQRHHCVKNYVIWSEPRTPRSNGSLFGRGLIRPTLVQENQS